METKNIVKVSPKMKTKIANIADCKWKDIAVVLFEESGITLYMKDKYGESKTINYNQI
jgi:hypothetical protein